MQKYQNQAELFDARRCAIALPEAEIEYYSSFLSASESQLLFEQLLAETAWRQEKIRVFGRIHATPRLSCWVGDAGLDYRYSNLTMQPVAWSQALRSINLKLSEATGHQFNSVLINYYRHGKDSNGWHSDNEPELGENPVIASISLGASRDFLLRNKADHKLKYSIPLHAGSLLLMSGTTQSCWQHSIPKRAHADARINLTFRTIKTRPDIPHE